MPIAREKVEELVYGRGMNLGQAGRELGVSRRRIEQILREDPERWAEERVRRILALGKVRQAALEIKRKAQAEEEATWSPCAVCGGVRKRRQRKRGKHGKTCSIECALIYRNTNWRFQHIREYRNSQRLRMAKYRAKMTGATLYYKHLLAVNGAPLSKHCRKYDLDYPGLYEGRKRD